MLCTKCRANAGMGTVVSESRTARGTRKIVMVARCPKCFENLEKVYYEHELVRERERE